MARPRRRHVSTYVNDHQQWFPLYSADTSRGWRVVRNVTMSDAERKVDLGLFRRVYNQRKECVGYQAVDTRPTDEALPSQNSSASITVSEMQANAGTSFKQGKSKTAALAPGSDQRLKRRHPVSGKALPPEDFVERATAKVRDWNLIGDDRAPSAGQLRRKRLEDERVSAS